MDRKRIIRATVIRSIVGLLLTGLVVALGIVVTNQIADEQKEEYFHQRLVQATTAAAAIDADDVAALKGDASDAASPAFKRVRDQLVRIKQSDMHVRFVYLMRPRGDDLIFLVDAEDPASNDYSPPGQVYEEAKPSDFDVFAGKREPETQIEGPISDRWGTWISATAYILRDGKPVALLGTDVDVARALSSVDQTRRLGYVFTLLAGVLMMLVSLQWVLWRYNRDQRLALRKDMEDSALRLNEKLINADRMKSDFIQLASHELRSPVNSVNLAVQTLDKSAAEKLNDDEKSLIRVAKNGSARLVDLVDNLLDITRIEAGDYSFRPKEVDAADLVDRTVQLFEPLAVKKDLKLEKETGADPVPATVDRQAILRILENLVSNALKFTEEGRVTVGLEAAEDTLLFSVADTGPGIPDSFKDEVFERFTRLEGSAELRQSGAGMGLALCKSLVESQGGRIWFESAPSGTTFFVEVPRVQEATAVEKSPPGDNG